MNRSKLIGPVLVSVMAEVQHMLLLISGLFAGSIQDNDGGLTSTFSTNSVRILCGSYGQRYGRFCCNVIDCSWPSY